MTVVIQVIHTSHNYNIMFIKVCAHFNISNRPYTENIIFYHIKGIKIYNNCFIVLIVIGHLRQLRSNRLALPEKGNVHFYQGPFHVYSVIIVQTVYLFFN